MTIFQTLITLLLVVPVLVIACLSYIDARRYPDRERPPIEGGSSGAG